ILGQIRLNPNNRVNPPRLARLIKLDRPIHCAVISNRQVLHPQRLGLLHQLLRAAEPIQQGILRMHMQMRKVSTHKCLQLSNIFMLKYEEEPERRKYSIDPHSAERLTKKRN